MKGSTIAIIGAGAAAAAAGIALALSAKAQAAPPPPSCSCPSGEVCQNTDGSCPSGYFPDPNNAGCCQKCVQSAPCGCDEVFDNVLCECSKLVPAIISVPASVNVYPWWMVYYDCNNDTHCRGFEGANLPSCQFKSGECNSDAFLFSISGKVTDSAGHPICNVPLDFSTSLSNDYTGTIPWTTPDGYFEGEWSLGIGTPSETDSEGNFTIDVTQNIDITATHACCDPLTCGAAENVRPMPFSFSITVTIPGTEISMTFIVLVNNTICEWNNYTG